MAGDSAADRISWQQADILAWTPTGVQFDLMCAHFVHMPKALRDVVYPRLAAAVVPAGDSHCGPPPFRRGETTIGRLNVPDCLFTAKEIAELLDKDEWELLVAAASAREMVDSRGSGRHITIHDAVLSAARRVKTQL